MSDTNSNSVDFRGIDALSENETEGNPDVWQAVWKQNDAAHRLWISAGTHSAALSDTPGWKPGSHMRCVKAVREADCCDELESTFIALHEPAADVDSLPVQNVEILPVSDDIGPEALALRITCDWGTYLVFNQFEREGIIDGIRFQGRFGILGSTTDDMNTDPPQVAPVVPGEYVSIHDVPVAVPVPIRVRECCPGVDGQCSQADGRLVVQQSHTSSSVAEDSERSNRPCSRRYRTGSNGVSRQGGSAGENRHTTVPVTAGAEVRTGGRALSGRAVTVPDNAQYTLHTEQYDV